MTAQPETNRPLRKRIKKKTSLWVSKAFTVQDKLYLLAISSHRSHLLESEDGENFQSTKNRLHQSPAEEALPPNQVLVPDFQKDNLYHLYVGGQKLKLLTSADGRSWNIREPKFVELPVPSDEIIHVDLAEKLPRGILLCYRLVSPRSRKVRHRAHLALLSLNDPSHVIWHSSSPFWKKTSDGSDTPFAGTLLYRSQIYSFWNTSTLGPLRIRHDLENLPFQLPNDHVIALHRAPSNPLIYPRPGAHWESFATYNPAAFFAEGRVHIFYRAQGPDLISSIGYASSKDGVTLDERLENPVYVPQEVFESFQRASPSEVDIRYVSGGGIAGCEDPRVTLIEDRVFMTYVAFDGASPPRVALTSIALDDLLQKQWHWTKPVLISPPGIVDKSAVIFPEKINGKYVIMHRIFPHIQIDYVNDLDFKDSRWLEEKDRIETRDNMWDSRKIGAGAPPIKTSEGWLLIYYGVDDRDDRQYKIGAMLLDLEDPTKVLYRSSTPILEPQHWYENSGFKPGIVYPCGAVVIEDQLHVYYGGADCVVCVASRNLSGFLTALKNHSQLTSVPTTLQIADQIRQGT